jgi:hypothetical protein
MTQKPPLKKGTLQRGLKPNLTKPPVNEDEIDESDSLLEKVEKELAKDGIIPFDNSDIIEKYLILPADITEEPSQDLGRYFNTFTKQKIWCRTLLGRTSALLRELTEKLDDIRDSVYSQLPPKMSVKEKELKLRSHEVHGIEASELLTQVAFLEEKRHMLDIYLDNLVDCIFNISREISRRESDMNDSNRADNIDNKRRK